jgi:hypothetical protein
MDWFSSGRRDIASRNTIIKAYKGNTSAGHIRIACELLRSGFGRVMILCRGRSCKVAIAWHRLGLEMRHQAWWYPSNRRAFLCRVLELL